MADTEEKVDLRNDTVTIIGNTFIVAMSAGCALVNQCDGGVRVSVHMTEDEVCALLAGLQEALA